MNIIFYLASKSFKVVTSLFSITFLAVTFLKLFTSTPLPEVVSYIFWFVSGTFTGYCIAYYSIKYLKNR